jgi:hypothetical protein
MALNRVEQIAALSLFAKPDYKELVWLVETTRNLPAKQKITALARIARLALDRDDDDARRELLPILTDSDAKVLTVARDRAYAEQATA